MKECCIKFRREGGKEAKMRKGGKEGRNEGGKERRGEV